jgi:transcriptional regulator with XRE-family HTH domain
LDKNSIGKRIKELRKLHGLNQIEFSEKIGISQGHLSEIESGKLLPSLETVIKMGEQFKLDIAWLIHNETNYIVAQLSKDEERLVNLYRQLQDIAKDEVLDLIELKLKRFKK